MLIAGGTLLEQTATSLSCIRWSVSFKRGTRCEMEDVRTWRGRVELPTLEGSDDLLRLHVISIRVLKNAINPFGKRRNCLGGNCTLTNGQQTGDIRDDFYHFAS